MKPRDRAVHRAGGRCEAMVLVGSVWARCWDRPVEVHHALTRARGGNILDSIGEDYHLICLCHRHHQSADGQEAFDGELLIDGYVTIENGVVVYDGTDETLRSKYGRVEVNGEGEVTSHHDEAREVDRAS